MTGILIDTNVLVYIYDRAETEKRQQAIDVLTRIREAGTGVLSAQVLSEFYNTVTRKLTAPLSPTQAQDQLALLARVWTVFPVTAQVVLEAARGVRAYQFSFWDAQIWAAARLNRIPVVLSEDFNTDAESEGVRFVNPFAAAFDPAAWGL